MTMLLTDGYDDGVCLGALLGSVAPTIQTAAPRTGTRSLRCQTSASSQTSFVKYTIANTTTGVCHVAMNLGAAWLGGVSIIQLIDTATLHAELRLNAAGKFEVYSVGTLRATGTFVYSAETWVQVQLKWTINDSTGLIEVRINGATSADATFSGDVRNGANAYVNVVQLGQQSVGVNTTGSPGYLDDLVIVDDQGSYNTGYLGDVEAKYTFATGAGDQQDWTIAGSSPAGTAYQSVNEVPVDDGVTLLESSTVSHRFLLGWEDLSNTSATIFAVATNLRAQKASAVNREIKSTAKRTSTTLGGLHTLSTSWATYQHIRETDTEGVNPWTGTNFNSTQWGCDVVT
jgi:hypothetical protein